jgi:hypothetical protein
MAADRLLEVLDALRARGLAGRAELILVGSGSSPAVLASLLRDAGVASAEEARRLRLRAVVDPRRLAFARLGAVSGVLNTFAWGPRWRDNLAGLLRFPVECCLRGRVPGVNAGSPWQQAATIVLAPAREELYALRETAPGFPALDAEALAAAVRRGLGGGGGGAKVKARRGSAAGASA